MISDYFLLAVNSLKRRKLRSWLTMIGIFIGIAAVVALISLGQGMQNAIEEQFEQLGADKIIIQSKGTIGPPGSETGSFVKITEKDLETVRKVNGINSAAGMIMKTGRVEYKDQVKFVFVLGMPQDALEKRVIEETQSIGIQKGKDLEKGDDNKAVVGIRYLEGKVFDKKIDIRDTLVVEGKEFKIAGIMKKIGNPYDDSMILLTKDAIKDIFEIKDDISIIIAKTSKGDEPEKIADSVEKALRKSRNEDEGKETFQIQTSEQILEAFSTVFGIVQAVLVGIAAISLLVGGIGIMNTMYTSVLERTKEIGTMKAVGAKNSDILRLFLIEAGMLGLIGGAIGIVIGIGLGKFAEYIASIYLGTPLLQAYFGWQLIAGALVFSFLIGSISGLFPAMQAAKLKPVDALRYE